MARPLIVIDPQPRGLDEIFEPKAWARLERLGELAIHDGPGRMPAERFEALSARDGAADRPERHAEGQARRRAEIARDHQRRDQFPAERRLRGLLRARNPCARAGLRFRQAGRRNGAGHGDRPLPRRYRRRSRDATGDEKWLLDGAEGCFSLYGARVGLIGFGDLARAFTPLLAPFGCPVKAYDPWISDHFMAGFGVAAASLDEVLATSQVIVVFAAATSENQGFLGKTRVRLDRAGRRSSC